MQAGVYGPRLEEQLNARGYTFGHYPDSFTHSTLGGWIATRSSGMQSDRYGDIADATRGLRVVTPAGLLVTRPVPGTSTGPSVREMVLGSEGRLGIICEATVQVRRTPAERTILGYLLPSWDGVARGDARHRGQRGGAVGHARGRRHETAFSFATKKGSSLVDKLQSKALKTFLERRKGFDLEQMCLGFIGYEGPERPRQGAAQGGRAHRLPPRRHLHRRRARASSTTRRSSTRPTSATTCSTAACSATCRRPPRRGARCPASTTRSVAAARGAFAELGVQGYVMCHMSHSYHAGACLYFTFAMTPSGRRDGLEEYGVVKSAVQQAFVDNGGTLSHHHAVGTEHAEWLEQDISAPGVGMLRALFDGTDPGANLNPGKIV